MTDVRHPAGQPLGPLHQTVDVLGIVGSVLAYAGIAWFLAGVLLLAPLLGRLAVDPSVPYMR